MASKNINESKGFKNVVPNRADDKPGIELNQIESTVSLEPGKSTHSAGNDPGEVIPGPAPGI